MKSSHVREDGAKRLLIQTIIESDTNGGYGKIQKRPRLSPAAEGTAECQTIGRWKHRWIKPSGRSVTLLNQAQELERLRQDFGLPEEDLNLDLGPLGKLL